MNKKQKIVLWVGVIIIVLIGLFPPWNYVCVRRSPVPISPEYIYIKNAGYHFLWNPPSHLIPENRLATLDKSNPKPHTFRRLRIENLAVSEVRLNNRRLLAQYIIVLPILGLLFTFAFRTKSH
ncbi:unnamed protein product [marine sediment metagenome]|uniref:Uncharacterized protein n=1 Tax=marine sediment metagenome TaxID=412755 RepID=X1AHN1_9ZZZZ